MTPEPRAPEQDICAAPPPLPRRDRSPLHLFLLRLGWEFTNTILLIAGLVLLWLVSGTPIAHAVVRTFADWGYLGAFLTGLFFASTFTVAAAIVVLFALASILPPVPLALVAGFGAMLGDYIIFTFVRDHLVREWIPVYCRVAGTPLGRVFSSPFFAWFAPVLGAFIIATPLPDEVGVSLLGIAGMRSWKMLGITFVLNAVGILAIVTIAHAA